MVIAVVFTVRGLARFLSHAETMRVFERAFIRAGIEVEYTCGFNPRPRLSLPLPRSVGVETEGDLLCVRPETGGIGSDQSFDAKRFKGLLGGQLPAGFELGSVILEPVGTKFVPRRASYIFTVSCEGGELQRTAQNLLASKKLEVDRFGDGKGKARRVDVRAYIESIDVDGRKVVVRCLVGPGGSVRVDELLALLDLKRSDLAGPIRRTAVEWQRKYRNR